MKVFCFSGNLIYNYGEINQIQGYFIQEEGETVVGYLQEKKYGKIYLHAIKGIYHESTNELILVKTDIPKGYYPEIYVFIDTSKEGYLSVYNKDYGTFTIFNGGIRNGIIQLDTLKSIYEFDEESKRIYSKCIYDMYQELYQESTSISKTLILDVTKYKWLFGFIKHLEKGAN